MRLEVDADALGASGRTVRAMARRVERLAVGEVGEVGDSVAAAMPGSVSAALAGEVCVELGASLTALAQDMDAHAERLDISATQYDAAETGVTRLVRVSGRDFPTAGRP